MIFDFARLAPRDRYKLLSSTVVPRPIAWVSTLGPGGVPNAAPFSFFNVFGEDPPVVGFSINAAAGARDVPGSDTGENVRLMREFVVNLVDEAAAAAMNVTAITFPPEVDEIAEAGLHQAPSVKIRTPRIAESPVSLECTLQQVVQFGRHRSLIIGEVQAMHVTDRAVIDAERCYVDTAALQVVGRMQAHTYVHTADQFTMKLLPLKEYEAAKG